MSIQVEEPDFQNKKREVQEANRGEQSLISSQKKLPNIRRAGGTRVEQNVKDEDQVKQVNGTLGNNRCANSKAIQKNSDRKRIVRVRRNSRNEKHGCFLRWRRKRVI